MDDFAGLEKRFTTLDMKFAAAERLREQESAEIRSDIALLAAQLASFEQRHGRRFLGLETRTANIEAVQGKHTELLELHKKLLEQHTKLLEEILRRLPDRT